MRTTLKGWPVLCHPQICFHHSQLQLGLLAFFKSQVCLTLEDRIPSFYVQHFTKRNNKVLLNTYYIFFVLRFHIKICDVASILGIPLSDSATLCGQSVVGNFQSLGWGNFHCHRPPHRLYQLGFSSSFLAAVLAERYKAEISLSDCNQSPCWRRLFLRPVIIHSKSCCPKPNKLQEIFIGSFIWNE